MAHTALPKTLALAKGGTTPDDQPDAPRYCRTHDHSVFAQKRFCAARYAPARAMHRNAAARRSPCLAPIRYTGFQSDPTIGKMHLISQRQRESERPECKDRKSVVTGKSVSVRLELGGP